MNPIALNIIINFHKAVIAYDNDKPRLNSDEWTGEKYDQWQIDRKKLVTEEYRRIMDLCPLLQLNLI